MYWYLLRFETRQSLRSPFYYGCLLAALAGALFMVWGKAGLVDGADLTKGPQPIISSPYSLYQLVETYFKLFLLAVPVLVGTTVYRDYGTRAYRIMFSYPVTRAEYLFAKLGSSLLLLILLLIVLWLGTWFALAYLGPTHPRVSVLDWRAFAVSFGLYLLPNVLLLTVLVFVTVGLTRNRLAGVAVVFILLCGPFLLGQVAFRYPLLLAYLDPFGQETFRWLTHSWDWETRQSGVLPVAATVWVNRTLWLGVSIAAVGYFYQRFQLQYASRDAGKPPRKDATPEYRPLQQLPSYRAAFSFQQRVAAVRQLASFNLRVVLWHWFFWLSLLAGILLVLFLQWKVTHTGDFNLLPQTQLLLGAPLQLYALLVLLATWVMSGYLLHLARDSRFHHLIDATPVRRGQQITALVLSLILLQAIMWLVFMITAIGLQTMSGYFRYEIGVYSYHIIVYTWPSLVLWTLTSVAVFALLPGLLSGLAVLLGLWLSGELLRNLGWESVLANFNGPPVPVYSDLYGYGPDLAYWLILAYWCLWGVLGLSVALLFWRRGMEENTRSRWRSAWQSHWFKLRVGIIVSLLLVALLGVGMFRIENREQIFLGRKNLESLQTSWADIPADATQLQIQRLDLDLELFPSDCHFSARGRYFLLNTATQALDTVLIRTGFDEETVLSWSKAAFLLRADSTLKYYVYVLDEPLAPGDSVQLKFSISNLPNGYFIRNSNVLPNATFLRHDMLPRLGWPLTGTDTTVHYFGRDAGRLQVRTRMQVPITQAAIAPGSLVSRTTQGERQNFVYETKWPVKFNFSFHSGDYVVTKEEEDTGVALEVYHHPAHQANVAEMLAGLRAALHYHEARFGPYPGETIRIIEVPHTEADFAATLMANNIPASERLFSINSEAMANKLQLPFYIMAHELTHEWFGNQLLPAQAPGATVLTESITEYLTLSIYEQAYGPDAGQRFLAQQHQRYQGGRRAAKTAEPALRLARAEQQYLTYGKGSLALRALSIALGQSQFDTLLQRFLLRYPPDQRVYPTADDFIRHLENDSPPHQRALISECLGSVVHYDLTVKVGQSTSDSLQLQLNYTKWQDGVIATLEPINVEFAQYNATGGLLSVAKLEVLHQRQSLRVSRATGAVKGVLDPRYLLLDQDRGNNSVTFKPLDSDAVEISD